MSSSLFALIISTIPVALALLSIALFAYAAYWAFNIRRGQAVGVYRNQALGMGFIALAWILVFFNYVVFGTAGLYALFTLINSLILTMAFYWVDSSVLAARRSDPLLRDTLHWQKLRVYLWWIQIAITVVVVLLVAYYEYVIGVEPQFLLNLPVPLPGAIPIFAAIIVLPIAAYRSRDKYLRRNLAWFVAWGVITVISTSLAGTSNSFVATIETFGGLSIGAYCLYRSVKSLVPLNRISAGEKSNVEPPPL